MHHLPLAPGDGVLVDIDPASAGWRMLDFRVEAVPAGSAVEVASAGREVALVPLAGRARIEVGGAVYELEREGVFSALPQVLYLPPGSTAIVRSEGSRFEFATGGAPAEGRYPVRLFQPSEMRSEVRGGGAARRQVNHLLSAPMPAERLILFEVYVPGGMWSGWPPHCHDGRHGSPYLEEVYHYRFDRPGAFALHRNYTREGDFDELFSVKDGDTVLVTRGFHPVAAAPGCNMYFLNYLAGDLLDGERATPPVDDVDFTAMKDDWDGGAWTLPVSLRGA